MDFIGYLPSLIVALVIAASIIVSGILTIQSNNRYRKVSETDIIFRLSDRIYDSEKGRKIIEMAKNSDKVIVDFKHSDGGQKELLPHRDVENFLNDVEMIFTLQQNNVLTKSMFRQAFSWVIDLIIKNKSMITFIEEKQKEYGDVAWKPISDYYHNQKITKNKS